MKHLAMHLILALAFSMTLVAQARSKRAIPDDNLAYPVLITLKGGVFGSGFYVDTGSATYLVTAKHVLINPATQGLRNTEFEVLSYSKNLSDPQPNIFSVDLSALGKDNIKPHPSQDVIVIRMFSNDLGAAGNTMSPIPGVTVKQVAKDGIVSVSLNTIEKFDQVLVGNEVIVLGYPNSLGLQAMAQIDPHRPLIRRGVVAGENLQQRSIVLDCPSYPGNSGSPVIEVDTEGFTTHFSIIGVISQYVPYADGGNTFTILANSGYSTATPMDFVLDLVK